MTFFNFKKLCDVPKVYFKPKMYFFSNLLLIKMNSKDLKTEHSKKYVLFWLDIVIHVINEIISYGSYIYV